MDYLNNYPMPHAGHPTGSVPDFGFSVADFLPSSGDGFSQELMVPIVTATIMACKTVFESFMLLN